MPEIKETPPKQKPSPKNVEYKPFRDLTIVEIKKLDTVLVKLEKLSHKDFGDSVKMTIEFNPMFKKIIRSDKIIDIRKYNLIVLTRKDLNEEEDIHVLKLPVRFFQRHDIEGNIKYKRFEVMFSRKVVISDFFDFTDHDLIDTLTLDFEFKEDKDSSDEFTIAQAEMDYVHFS